ncbi:probable U3 small nucleolar RNA-associated protein 7 [Saccharomycodes ludwigii]|uniref:U three protein 7 n=1 Tax=Saccharomycodes ludwigii TaxID=36035 RepID=A0A376B7P2_9ASCO|nr:hypothetical protein SCDLUD_000302 [Saccharomycodes ludwigii]KAH3902717.1 hypothetical protein SCDLUD_000302 [Saccharomycodes ludwigii]SSD60716.1 probable U3 small nucleolar RNA-associated protein 7 [Saccharomycodes ludwigii]
MDSKKVHSKKRTNQSKYERNFKNSSKTTKRKIRDKKLKAGLKKLDEQYNEAVSFAAATEYLLPETQGFIETENDLEKTFKVTQDEIKASVDITTANKALDLKLNEFAPYKINYSRNGTHLLICGRKGHIASMDWRKGELRGELFLNETCNDATYLQNEQYFAVAQKKYTFIYDHEGVELHRLKQHVEAKHLSFLPYHYLLATSGQTGWLKYQDISTGALVSELKTKLGPTTSMCVNPWNAVMHLGHGNGTVTLWAPNMSTPLVRLLSGRGPINSIAIDRSGTYMATVSADKSMKIWDIRNFKELHNIDNLPTPGTNVEISDTGLLAMSWGSHVTLWKDALKSNSSSKPYFTSSKIPDRNSPYMSHLFPNNKIENMKFVPFEDLLGVGHSKGVTNLIVPGSGEANFDALELNPFESAKQRQDQEVRSLLYKLPADSISLDPNIIGTVDNKASAIRLKSKDMNNIFADKNSTSEKNIPDIRADVKSKNSGLRGFLRKKTKNVIDERKQRVEHLLKMEKDARQKKIKIERGEISEDHQDPVDEALSRFS